MAARRLASARCRRRSCSNSPSSCSSPIAISPATPTPSSKDFGFGRAHHRVLHFVNRHSGLRVADLLDILTITKQSLSRVLKQLIDQGYIVQQAGSADRRERLAVPHRARPGAGRAAGGAAARAPVRGVEGGGARVGSGAAAVSWKRWSMPRNAPKFPLSWPLLSLTKRVARGMADDRADAAQGASRQSRRQRAAYSGRRRR